MSCQTLRKELNHAFIEERDFQPSRKSKLRAISVCGIFRKMFGKVTVIPVLGH